MEKEKPIGEATAEQIKEWKETHKNVFAIKVDDADGRKHVCYLRAPKRKDPVSYTHLTLPTIA